MKKYSVLLLRSLKTDKEAFLIRILREKTTKRTSIVPQRENNEREAFHLMELGRENKKESWFPNWGGPEEKINKRYTFSI